MAIGVGIVLALIGALEGWWERIDYPSDTISYLDIVRAIGNGDWKLALNPLWSLGYPLLLAVFKPLFPNTPAGEWTAAHVLNLLILLATWFAFLLLVRSLRQFAGKADSESGTYDRGLFFAAAAVFIACQLTIGSTWLISPDLLVCCLTFITVSLLLRLIVGASSRDALLLGLTLGIGYIVKAAFLVFSLITISILATALWKRKRKLLPAIVALLVLAAFAIPYSAALSWSFGRFTLGEAGNINYAWWVNKLQIFFHWQGGPQGYGVPIHPTQQVLSSPRVFVFDKPFPVSYPPFFNPPYFYEGYRHFFNFSRQAHEILVNLKNLARVIGLQPLLCILLAGALWIFAGGKRRMFGSALGRYWPALTVGLCGIATFVPVHLEGRYIAPFLAIVGITIFLAMRPAIPARIRRAAGPALIVCALFSFGINETDVFRNLAKRQSYDRAPDWKMAMWLSRSGLRAGDKVAVISPSSAAFCEWAYLAHLRIVGEAGVDLYRSKEENLAQYWGSSARARQDAVEAFRQAGAAAIIAFDKPENEERGEWVRIPETSAWVQALQTAER
ncbi:MAG: hypothetical protein JO336_06255 [Acidobacteriia bacterium]|nr:hypothetical protein [Terriglobia bacterium]MBV8906795.1 hypothetical protein [Terriglobia bacterium]